MKIIFPDHIDIPYKQKQQLITLGADFYNDLPETEQLKKRLADAEIVVPNYVDLPQEVIDAAPQLKYIIAPSVGYDWIDSKYAASKSIQTLNCPTFNSQAVAEHFIGLLLALKRKIISANSHLAGGMWLPADFAGTEVNNARLGLVGYGNIGKKIESLAAGLGMKVEHVNSRSNSDEVDALLADSDVICLCAQLNEQTRHMIDDRRLKLMRKDALLINISRGAVIDQAALIRLLKAAPHFNAALDVFENEPLTGKPNKDIVQLANLPNVIATPHIGYNTIESQKRLGEELFEAIKACLAGRPINVVAG